MRTLRGAVVRKKGSDDLLMVYATTRDLRDRIKAARDGCSCERHEGFDLVDGVITDRLGEACWKAARKWSDRGPDLSPEFYLDPPIDEWCATCRNRQAYTEQLRAAVKDHAAAKRSILQRGRALVRATPGRG